MKEDSQIRDISLNCKICGTDFLCRSGPPGSCWCHNSPNTLKSWDLAGECVCPDCLAGGKRNEILQKREQHFLARNNAKLRKNIKI